MPPSRFPSGFVKLTGANYKAVADSKDPIAVTIMENYRTWCHTLKRDWCDSASSVLFDTVAVYLGFSEKHLIMEDLKLTVEADGLTAVSPKGRPVRCATEWSNLEAFNTFLVDRLIHGKVAKARN